MLASAVLFGFKVILIKLAFKYGSDTISILLLRLLFALPFYIGLLIYVQRSKHKYKPSKSEWWTILMLGFLGFYVASFLDFWGLNYLPAGLERVISFSVPAIVLVLAFLLHKTPITKTQIISTLVCYLGIAIAFLNQDEFQGGNQMAFGAMLVFGSATSYALYLIYSGRMLKTIPTVFFTCTVMIVSTVFVAVHYIIGYDITQLFKLHPNIYWYGLAMAFFSTVLPTLMFTEGIKRIGAGNAAILSGVGPISTIILAAIILGEHFSTMQYLGTLLVIVGVVIISRSTKSKKKLAAD